MYVFYNPNYRGKYVEDCVIRALCKALNSDWETIFVELSSIALFKGDMPDSGEVWGSYLREKGFSRHVLPNECPECYTIKEFCYDHPHGTYVLATRSHVVAVVSGNYYDSYDSGDKTPIFYWEKD